MNWERLRLQSGRADNFDDEVTASVRKLAGITVDGARKGSVYRVEGSQDLNRWTTLNEYRVSNSDNLPLWLGAEDFSGYSPARFYRVIENP